MYNDFNLDGWLEVIKTKILETFDKRVKFIGYQGSYKRGEATDTSDVDMVVLLDEVTFEDLNKYHQIVKNMVHSEKACGFLGGIKEIQNWPKFDVFQLIYDTDALYGSLNDFVPQIEKDDVKTAVKNGAANLYHAAVHSFLYDKDKKEALRNLYKSVFFILQAQYFLNEHEYISKKQELLNKSDGLNKEIMNMCINKEEFEKADEKEVDEAYKKLILFASNLIVKY